MMDSSAKEVADDLPLLFKLPAKTTEFSLLFASNQSSIFMSYFLMKLSLLLVF